MGTSLDNMPEHLRKLCEQQLEKQDEPITVRVNLPIPPKALNPNVKPHHIVKARSVKWYRNISSKASWVDCIGPFRKATIQIVYYHPTKAHKDTDNIIAHMKAGIDGLVDGMLLADDNEVTYLPVIRKTDKDIPRVELFVTEVK